MQYEIECELAGGGAKLISRTVQANSDREAIELAPGIALSVMPDKRVWWSVTRGGICIMTGTSDFTEEL